MRTKLFHQLEPKRLRCTVAIDTISKNELFDLMIVLLKDRKPAYYDGKFGVAFVHPKDQHFVKKVGGQVAKENGKDSRYHLMSVEAAKDGTLFKMAVETTTKFQGPSLIKLNLFTELKSDVVYIQFVDVTALKRR